MVSNTKAGNNVDLLALHPDVRELQRLKELNQASIAALAEGGEFEQVLFTSLNDILFPIVQEEMPFATGTSWAAQRSEIRPGELEIYTDPSAINPISLTPPTEYLPIVFRRRGKSPYPTAVNRSEGEMEEVAGDTIMLLPIVSGKASLI